MSTNYRLVLARSIPPAVMLERILPSQTDSSVSPKPYSHALRLDLNEQMGFHLSLRPPQENKYAGASTDDGEWSWQLPVATSLSFGVYPFYDGSATPPENILKVVARVLSTGDEDLAFTLEYDLLYLLRQGGAVTKNFRDEFWNHRPLANQLIPG